MGISSITSTSPFALTNLSAINAAAQAGAGDSSSVTSTSSNKQDSFRSDFASLLKAVQSGDITSAQSALSTLQTDLKSANAGYSPDSTSASASTAAASPAQTDLDSLFQAVQSGNIAGAQASLTQLQSDSDPSAQQSSAVPSGTQKAQGHHHHHHGGGGGGGLEAAVSSAFASETTADGQDTSSSTAATVTA